jgi:hypothetical protein
MVATRDASVRLTSGESTKVFVSAACADLRRHVPDNGSVFTGISHSPGSGELARLMSALGMSQLTLPQATIQAAVWIVTDDADYYGLDALVDYYGPGTHGDRVIREYEAARACGVSGVIRRLILMRSTTR